MSNSSQIMIQADGLTKSYGDHTAVDDLSFTCKKGEIVGFLGPNGAGKTTTMRMLTGYMPPTSGAAYIAGHHAIDDSIAARRQLGYLPETVPLYPEMRVRDYLKFVGDLRRVRHLPDRIKSVLTAVDLRDRADSFISSLSKGMRQRVGMAQAMIHNPRVLIMDEPTIGLDPRQIADIRDLINDIGQQHTILLSTHILSEVEHICDRVIMIINGRIHADMPLKEAIGGRQLTVTLAAPADDTIPTLSRLKGVGTVQQINGRQLTLQFDGRDTTRQAVAETAVNNGWGLLQLADQHTSLETIFLEKLRQAEQA